MNLRPLKKFELHKIFQDKYAKYLSQHTSNRHYIISYNSSIPIYGSNLQYGTFINETYENNIKLGMSNGIYKIKEDDNNNAIMSVHYKHIYNSPNITSPFHPDNTFYPKLSNYSIGPFYTIISNKNQLMLPVLYKHLVDPSKFKILNFYDK
jgi:hypothetical protein